MLSEASNKELLSAWKQGNQQAAQLLVGRYMLRLTALARSRLSRKLSRRLDPEDVVLSAWRSFFVAAEAERLSVPDDDNLWPLLLTLTLRKLSRQASRHTSIRRSVDAELATKDLAEWYDVVARDPSPDEAAILVDEVESLMQRLDVNERNVLALRLQGENHSAIARSLHCSERSVGRTMQRIRALLNECDESRNSTVASAADEIDEPVDDEPTGSPAVRESRLAETQPTIAYSDLTMQKLIGIGGFGKVYRASRHDDGTTVAVKYLKKRFWGDKRAKHSLLEETKRVSSLSHPNIIRHQGWGVSPSGALFVVMDWVDGSSLGEWRQLENPTVSEVIQCGVAVAVVLLATHEAGIVHADLAPGNVIRRSDGAFYLTDFGFARSLEHDTQVHAGGTPGFLAPEQISDVFGPVGTHTDIYGLGGLLYWLLTGTPPTNGVDVPEMLASVVSSQPLLAASTRVAGIPHELDELLNRCLNKEPRERFSSMQDVHAALQALTNSEPHDGSTIHLR